MRFDCIEIEAFGALCDTRLDGLGGRLSVIFGPNGAGKTTLLHFLRGVCCGYEHAHRLGLLPAANDEPGGGALDVHWQGQRLRLTRSAAAGSEQPLRVTVVRERPDAPRFDPGQLPVDQIPLLYTVEHADVHTLDRLVQLARQSGIEFEARQPQSTRLTAAAPHGPTRQSQQPHARERIAELTDQRSQLQSALERLRAQLDERCQQLAEEHQTAIVSKRRRLWQRVDWLQAELQSAETVLREAEEAIWSRHRSSATVKTSEVGSAAPRRGGPSTEHFEVHHRQIYADIDRAIAEARARLAQIAQTRLDVNLQAARIAGSVDLPTGEFLTTLRASMTRMEGSLLELYRDAERIDCSRQQHDCRCETWAATSRTAIDAIRRRLYRSCECVSQFELQHRKAYLRGESARLDQEERAQLDKLRSLQQQWYELTKRTDHLTSPRGPAQRRLEQELCECAEHPEDETAEPSAPSQTAVAPIEGDVQPSNAATNGRADEAELSRLRRRRSDLAAELETARQRLRAARVGNPPGEAPEDVRALERRIDRKRLERDAVEQELLHSQSRELPVTGDVARGDTVRAESKLQSQCIRWAGTYLSRLTAGRYVEMCVTENEPAVWVMDDTGRERSPRTLSRGTLNLAALSLRLALVRAFAQKGVRFPLVLDDVLVDSDIERLQQAVRLLREFAAEHDQQIVYLTCGTHLLSLFEAAAATVRFLPGTNQEAPEPRRLSESSAVPWSVQGWIDRQPRESDSCLEATSGGDRISRHGTPAGRPTIGIQSRDEARAPADASGAHFFPQPLQRRQPGEPYWLSAESRLLLVPSIGEQMGRRLFALGIRTVADLLTLADDASSIPLKSLQIEPDKLREWQAEALLLTCVPNLTGPDAQLLVACDVRDPDQLAASDVDQLIGRLDRYARRHQHSPLIAVLPSRESIARWIQSARRSRSLASIGLHIHSARRTGGDGVGTASRHTSPNHRERSTDRHRPSMPAKPTIPMDAANDDPSESDDAAATRLSLAAARSSQHESSEPRFYLHAASPVEDAPSIGPKMASQLKRLKINTVGDLLLAQPATVATRLKHRRVKEETVTIWQQQARLMCRIPQLRGHDAQVLVACDITEPEQVARLDAQTLFGIVGPFVATTEGQRLLRSSNTPDLEEVADWIKWANQARPLRAA